VHGAGSLGPAIRIVHEPVGGTVERRGADPYQNSLSIQAFLGRFSDRELVIARPSCDT